MNSSATKAMIKARHINLRSWSRGHGFRYGQVLSLLSGDGPIQETRRQREVIDALVADGLHVASEGADDTGKNLNQAEVS